MTWFKIDDTFCDHPKVVALQSSPHWKGAVALWTLAGSWCSRQLTDGRVPAAMVARLGGTAEEANALVTVGLWVRTEEGFAFHDWLECNPSREQVTRKRSEWADSKSKQRDAKRSQAESNSVSTQDTQQDSSAESEGLSGTESPLPVPSRPVPSRSIKNTTSSATADLFGDEAAASRRDESAEVFAHWKAVMGHPKAELDPKRRKAIAGALKRYSLEDCKAAIDGCKASPHHMGQNDRHTVYDRVGLIFDPDKIDGFIARANQARGLSMVRTGDAPDWHPVDGPPKSPKNDIVWNLWMQDGAPNDRSWRPRRKGAA